MEIITFRFWPDERESYRAQLADIERVYFETKFDQEKLSELFQSSSFVDFTDIEVKSHLNTHILILAQQWQFQVESVKNFV
ncbi:hypothetical protein [Loigolactobacillus coryniformis]|uniref:hypothetical protein n=1 Tax=Loigolactobacillus coryniformis TaxID=1610 RepID=UPI001C5DB479|nr:hypothetical protein [Loigolactobacillus coryniformis]MBW4803627.1 hypothetical protein [Loigolactobacillus coryniformis subsp. torquens]MBW4803856.1 hypothetical protein [Loigolactobacillus coryniformis subsp. torquens]